MGTILFEKLGTFQQHKQSNVGFSINVTEIGILIYYQLHQKYGKLSMQMTWQVKNDNQICLRYCYDSWYALDSLPCLNSFIF